MFIHLIGYALVVWFVLAVLSTAYVTNAQWWNNPEPNIIRAGFAPIWRQGNTSTIHCVAGDATGIILGAAIAASLGFPMWIVFLGEYTNP